MPQPDSIGDAEVEFVSGSVTQIPFGPNAGAFASLIVAAHPDEPTAEEPQKRMVHEIFDTPMSTV